MNSLFDFCGTAPLGPYSLQPGGSRPLLCPLCAAAATASVTALHHHVLSYWPWPTQLFMVVREIMLFEGQALVVAAFSSINV